MFHIFNFFLYILTEKDLNHPGFDVIFLEEKAGI